jgi:CRP-like cAMP-binding protein
VSEIESLLEANFEKYVKLSPQARAFLKTSFSEVTIGARSWIVQAGDIAKYFYFVLSGVQAIYLINSKGEKVVLGFSFDGTVSGVYDSFIHQAPSNYFLEALTDSRLIAINKERFDVLFEKFPELLLWRVHFMEDIMFGRSKREVEMLTLTAKQRYDIFIRRCPEELKQIPQKYLASYLNMKPETFSRFRAHKD